MLGCHSGGRLLALLTTSMKLSLASTNFKAATIRTYDILARIKELKDEEESLSRDMEIKELEDEKERHMAYIDFAVATKIEDLNMRIRKIKDKMEWVTEKMKTCGHIQESHAVQERVEKEWEEDNAAGNLAALEKLQRRIVLDVGSVSQESKFLWFTFAPTKNIVDLPPIAFENLNTTFLTLTERRAFFEHFRPAGRVWKTMASDKMMEKKWAWYCKMKEDFKEYLSAWKLHVDQYGPPGAHPYATKENPKGCPLIGNQCPLKADTLVNCAEDCKFTLISDYYGWEAGDEVLVKNLSID